MCLVYIIDLSRKGYTRIRRGTLVYLVRIWALLFASCRILVIIRQGRDQYNYIVSLLPVGLFCRHFQVCKIDEQGIKIMEGGECGRNYVEHLPVVSRNIVCQLVFGKTNNGTALR